MKATYCEINGRGKAIYKDPKTTLASGMTKKSLRGLIRVEEDENGHLYAIDNLATDDGGLLRPVFIDGQMYNETTLKEIRQIRNKEVLKVLNQATDNR